MARHLIKSDAEIRSIKPATTKLRLSDGGGLSLLLFVKGGSHGWRMQYTHATKKNSLSLGTYPDVGLAMARKRAQAIREQLAEGIDPSEARKSAKAHQALELEAEQRAADGLPAADSFEAIAREWYAKNASSWAASHADKTLARLENDAFPWIGPRPLAKIKPAEMLKVVQRVEQRGAVETAHRVLQISSQVFRYAVALGKVESDPTRDLRGALTPWKPVHYASIKEPQAIGELLRAIDGYQGHYVTRVALQLAPLLFVRPGELRAAEWKEINFAAAEWRIPAEKMKARRLHIVPLARQALKLVQDLQRVTGQDGWMFPSIKGSERPMSENTLNHALHALGYGRDKMTAHGFRSIASTLLHEQGWKSDVIERQLAHVEGNSVKAAYNYAEHLPERRRLMQAWADYLDTLRTPPSNVVPLRSKRKAKAA